MVYELDWENVPEQYEAERNAAWDLLDEARRARQAVKNCAIERSGEAERAADERVFAAQEALIQLMDAAPDNHQVLSHTMPRFRRAMHRFGMTFYAAEVPDLPNPDSYGTDAEQTARYEAAAEPGRAFHGTRADPGVIPVHKLSSNDAWHVLADECRNAISAYRTWRRRHSDQEFTDVLTAVGLADATEDWDAWIAFIDAAAEHDGFRVC